MLRHHSGIPPHPLMVIFCVIVYHTRIYAVLSPFSDGDNTKVIRIDNGKM